MNDESLILNDFVSLMLVMIAKNRQIIDLNELNKFYACLPVDYKERIRLILFEDNGWAQEFSKLINMSSYFENYFLWERNLALGIEKYLALNNKSFKYDFEYDRLIITFSKEEINNVLPKYSRDIINSMYHFVNLLLSDNLFSKEYNGNLIKEFKFVNRKLND